MTVPVALFTYNRPHHTKETLDALANNTLAKATDLYIFCDGPKNLAEVRATVNVRALVRTYAEFASIKIVERSQNMGLARSIITGVTEVLDKHDSIIVLEDDLVTSEHFLTFMNSALEHYRSDGFAFSVTGHTFPAPFLLIPKDYPFDTYAGYRCSSWSWGTWRDRWDRVDWDMNYYQQFCSDPFAQEDLNRGGSDITAMLKAQHEGKIDSWAIRFCYAHYANDMRCIYPVTPLVRNIGLDYSGTHSVPDPRYFHPSLDERWLPKELCPGNLMDPRITARFRSVFDPETSSTTKNNSSDWRSIPDVAQARSRYFGIRAGRKLINKAVGVNPRENTLLEGSDTEAGKPIERGLFNPATLGVPLPDKQTDILIVNSFQKEGGAARAAFRSFTGIKQIFPNTHYLTLFRDDDSDDISGLRNGSLEAAKARDLATIDQSVLELYPDRDRRMSLFTPDVLANPLRIPISRFSAKLLHLHWVAWTMLEVEELANLNVPVVWTLHDTWAFTGGCHYTEDCSRFKQSCGMCPQLGSTDEEDLSRLLWRRKQAAFSRLNLTVTTPSRWLGEIASQSSLLRDRRLEVIPNGLNTDVFRPVDKDAAKSYFGADPRIPVLLFGAQWLNEYRKGGDLLRQTIAQIDFPCILFAFGAGTPDLPSSEMITVKSFGSLQEDMSLALLYSAADVFVCPSRQENLPNTVAEALACGTPCAAFDIGGLPEMIEHQKTGWLAKPFDPIDLAAGIKWLVTHPNRSFIQAAARSKALADYSLNITSQRFAGLFTELLGAKQICVKLEGTTSTSTCSNTSCD